MIAATLGGGLGDCGDLRGWASYLLAQAKYQAEVAAYNALTTLDEARDGDEDARMKVAKAAAIGAAVVGICILRRSMKRRRRH